MLKVLRTYLEGLKEVDLAHVETGSWFNLISPTPEELEKVQEITGAPIDFLKAALDEEESSRVEIEEDHMLVITNIPKVRGQNSYDTMPLGIVIAPEYIVTVSLEENDVIKGFDIPFSQFFSTFKRTRFLFQILYKTASLFLKDLQQINRRTDEIERDLRVSMKNNELFQLLDLQKGLTYFTASLRSNRVVIEKLLRLCSNVQFHHLVKVREEDEDLLEDVKIEYDQAVEMVQMYSDILAGMMDAFASIISNNLNMVMKFLTSVTIILAIPTMIASFFGMNVPVPFGNVSGNPHGFLYVVLISAFLSIAAFVILMKKRMF